MTRTKKRAKTQRDYMDILVPLNKELVATLDRIADQEEEPRLTIIRRALKAYVSNYLPINSPECTVESNHQAA